jgi:hypothetical protein
MHEVYKAQPVSDVSSQEELVAYLRRELEQIEVAFTQLLPQVVHWLHAEPERLREGLVAGADGTDWNPGAGEGLYVYYAAAWHKLG